MCVEGRECIEIRRVSGCKYANVPPLCVWGGGMYRDTLLGVLLCLAAAHLPCLSLPLRHPESLISLPAPEGKPVLRKPVCCLSSGVFLSQPSGLHALSLGTCQEEGKHRNGRGGGYLPCLCRQSPCETGGRRPGGSQAVLPLRTAWLPEVLLSPQLRAGTSVVSSPCPGQRRRDALPARVSPGEGAAGAMGGGRAHPGDRKRSATRKHHRARWLQQQKCLVS